MTVESNVIRIETRKEGEILDITGAFVFVPGSTAALTTIEYEPGLLADLPSMLEGNRTQRRLL